MKHFFFFLFLINSSIFAGDDDHENTDLVQRQARIRCFDDGSRKFRPFTDRATWERSVREVSDNSSSVNAWRCIRTTRAGQGTSKSYYAVDKDILKNFLMGACEIIVDSTTGGISNVTRTVIKAVERFSEALGVERGEENRNIEFVFNNSRRTFEDNCVIDCSDYSYAISFYLSIKLRENETNIPPVNAERSTFNYYAGIALFEIPALVGAPRTLSTSSIQLSDGDVLYKNLPPDSITRMYIALNDIPFDDLLMHPPEGYGGWCQIVDTRDSEGNLIYTIKHYLRNRKGTDYSQFWSQPAQACIEVLIGSRYSVLSKAERLSETSTEEIYLTTKSSRIIDKIKAGAGAGKPKNRYEHWMKSTLVGMKMPQALSCENIVTAIENIIRSGNFRYGVYGCSSFGRVINCVPWPFMVWKEILGEENYICNENMQRYINFKMSVSRCLLDYGLSSFFNDDGSLVDSRIHLIDVYKKGGDSHRIWQEPETNQREGIVIKGKSLIACRFNWREKADRGLMKTMELTIEGGECAD